MLCGRYARLPYYSKLSTRAGYGLITKAIFFHTGIQTGRWKEIKNNTEQVSPDTHIMDIRRHHETGEERKYELPLMIHKKHGELERTRVLLERENL